MTVTPIMPMDFGSCWLLIKRLRLALQADLLTQDSSLTEVGNMLSKLQKGDKTYCFMPNDLYCSDC